MGHRGTSLWDLFQLNLGGWFVQGQRKTQQHHIQSEISHGFLFFSYCVAWWLELEWSAFIRRLSSRSRNIRECGQETPCRIIVSDFPSHRQTDCRCDASKYHVMVVCRDKLCHSQNSESDDTTISDPWSLLTAVQALCLSLSTWCAKNNCL